MSKWRKYIFLLLFSALILYALLLWYKLFYSMKVVQDFSVAVQNPQYQLLIASQGSDFKNAVVDGIITKLAQRPIAIKVIDVSGLWTVNIDKCNAFQIGRGSWRE